MLASWIKPQKLIVLPCQQHWEGNKSDDIRNTFLTFLIYIRDLLDLSLKTS